MGVFEMVVWAIAGGVVGVFAVHVLSKLDELEIKIDELKRGVDNE
jgi:outer membrane lipoprotein SlyB